MIIIAGFQQQADWRELGKIPIEYRKKASSVIVEGAKEIFGNAWGEYGEIESHSYPENVFATYEAWHQNQRNFKPLKLIDLTLQPEVSSTYDALFGEHFSFPCLHGKSCEVMFLIATNYNHQREDLGSFRSFVSSIRAHYIPDN